MNERKRSKAFDILRVIAMAMIITHHCVINSFGLQENLLSNTLHLSNLQMGILMMINSFVIIGVNIFFLISGYFGIKRNWKKIIAILIEIYIIYDLITIIGIRLGYVIWNKATILGLINPLSIYWFLLVYIIILFISPILNKIIDNTKEKEYKKEIIIILCIFSIYSFFCDVGISIQGGYTLIWGIILYLLGGFIKKFKIQNKNGLLIYGLFTFINGIMAIIFWKFHHPFISWKLYNYNNPLIITASLGLFTYINSLTDSHKESKGLSFFATSTLMTYLLHSSCWLTIFRNQPIQKMIHMGYFRLAIILLPLYVGIIYIMCSCVNIIYQKTIQKKINKWLQKIK